MEFLFEIFTEFLLQIVFQAIAEAGLHALAGTFKRQRNPISSAIGVMLLGFVAGVVSLFIFPHSFIKSAKYQLINLLVTPVAAGGVMVLIAKQREKRGQRLVLLDKFNYAFVFAFIMALVRFFYLNSN